MKRHHLRLAGDAERLWLRLRKTGDFYTALCSTDGKEFQIVARLAWSTGEPRSVGLVVNNGDTTDAPGTDACFDFFEVCGPTPVSAAR